MSTERDTARIVRSWLSTDEHESADRVLDIVLQRIDTTPQRRATRWPTRRLSPMNPILKFGLAAAVLAVVAFVGISYISAPNVNVDVGGGDVDQVSATPPTPEPTAAPIPWLQGGGILEAGTYRADPFIPVEVLITVPEGWTGGGNWLLLGPRGPESPDGMNIRFGSVENLYANPLALGDGSLDPPVGPTVDDLVDAMMSHPDWPTTGPTDVTIDGYAGKVVRLTLPTDLDLPGGRFLLFRDGASGERWAWEPGQIVDFYIIDVDGERLVLELFSYPDTPAADLAERDAVVESMQLRRQ